MIAGTGNKQGGAFLWKMLVGAAVGIATAAAFFAATRHVLRFREPAEMLTIGAGVSYVLIGLTVVLGLVAPRAGVRLLNVQDREELLEERPKLLSSGLACVLIGLFLTVVAAASEGAFDREVALLMLIPCAVAIAGLTISARRHDDELTRQLGLEASSLTLLLSLLLFGGWATLVSLGYATWVTPLGFLGGVALVKLFAIFVAAGRRGLLLPR